MTFMQFLFYMFCVLAGMAAVAVLGELIIGMFQKAARVRRDVRREQISLERLVAQDNEQRQRAEGRRQHQGVIEARHSERRR